MGIDGDPALFVAFAENLKEGIFGIDIGEFEIGEFADAQPTTVKDFDDDVVALLVGEATIEGGLYGGDFGIGKDVGEMFGAGGHFEKVGGIFGDIIIDDEHTEKSAPARDDAALGGSGDARIVELGDELLKVLERDIEKRNIVLIGKINQ